MCVLHGSSHSHRMTFALHGIELHQLKSNSNVVVNDSELRPPTTMAPPVPSKKKISIPSVFLVDDKLNGNATKTMERPPPPRPMRPSIGAGGVPLKCNPLSNSTSPKPSHPVQSDHSSLALLLSSHQSSAPLVKLEEDIGQPQPPPRRHQMGPGPVAASSSQSKCVSVQVILFALLLFSVQFSVLDPEMFLC